MASDGGALLNDLDVGTLHLQDLHQGQGELPQVGQGQEHAPNLRPCKHRLTEMICSFCTILTI